MEPVFLWHHYVTFTSNWESIWVVPMAWALFHKECKLTPPTLLPNVQDPEMNMAEQSGCFQDEDIFFIMRIASPLIKRGKMSQKRGWAWIIEQNYFCNVACFKKTQADAHRNSLPNYFTIIAAWMVFQQHSKIRFPMSIHITVVEKRH